MRAFRILILTTFATDSMHFRNRNRTSPRRKPMAQTCRERRMRRRPCSFPTRTDRKTGSFRLPRLTRVDLESHRLASPLCHRSVGICLDS